MRCLTITNIYTRRHLLNKEVVELEKLTKVAFTNLDKILYPEVKVTKAQVIQHYVTMAPRMLSILKDRPMVLTRFPDGVDKEGFYEKDRPMGTPPWVKTFKKYSETAKRQINYIVCNDLDTLVWLGNLAALELHMTLSQIDAFERPDLVFFDLDPEPPVSMDDVVDVALLLKKKLEDLNLRSYVKTSGKKGLHILVPTVREYTFAQTREYVHQIGRYLAHDSSIVTPESSKPRKPGTVHIDYTQNSHGRTMVCPYSLRATSQATVSMPLDWSDVKKGLKPQEFTLVTTAKSKSNPWKGMLEDKQRLEQNVE
jgi:bifunctional non-homologous end joining protein LigD